MQDHQTVQTLLSQLSDTIAQKYPVLGLGLSLALGTIGTFFPNMLEFLSDIEIPKVIMQLGQWLFWVLGSGVSIIVARPAIIKFIESLKSKKNKQ
jgi:hypothetical protein